MKRNQYFYAVRKGREPDVYDTWAEAKKQVQRFPGHDYRKFSRRSRAEAYLKGDPPVTSGEEPHTRTEPAYLNPELESALEEAMKAWRAPVLKYRGQTIRMTHRRGSAPYVRLLQAVGCHLNSETEAWLRSLDKPRQPPPMPSI